MRFFIPLILITIFSACHSNYDKKDQAEDRIASIVWSLDSISLNPAKSYVTWNIKNNSTDDWAPKDWSIHFNQIAGAPISSTIPAFINFENPGGEYVKLHFNESADTLRSDATLSFNIEMNGHIKRMSNVPQGVFIVKKEKIYDIKDVTIEGVNHETLALINPSDASSRYASASEIDRQKEENVQRILPLPITISYQDGNYTLKNQLSISFDNIQSKMDKQLIQAQLKEYFNGDIKATNEKAQLSFIVQEMDHTEAYKMSITSDNDIKIIAGSSAGLYYGFQSLIQLINPVYAKQKSTTITLPNVEIEDQPRFEYRGYMLDVARNFHKKEKVKEVLDLMSRYKLNKFHFHIMDDEGWRLEIPGLPELTEVGSRRGYTPDESDRLRPAYGSGGDVNASYSTGYYTREDYIDIIQYAHARHIEVIPEIDLPGHARAAIVSMRARYNRLMTIGKEKEAEEYMLHDPDDESVYSSAQNYNDNVINLCRESSYTFIEKVLRETIQMHIDAGVPLKTLHTGGDEVPYGAWQGSPICQSFISDMENLSGTDDLHPNMLYFIRNILNEYNIVTAGWEEIVLAHTADGHNGTAINEDLVGEPMLPYVWNASWGWGREDMAYKLANAGFDAVMCNSASYYFDLAYDSDPREGGLDWSGLTNAKTAFDLEPLNIMKNAKYDLAGNILNSEYIKSKEGLKANAKNRIKGIQAQLWSETLYNAELVDYMTFPKLLGFAQRSWSSSTTDYNTEYNNFVNTVGQRELIRLDNYGEQGVHYRIPPPGIDKTKDQVTLNTIYPGLVIRYTLDGKEPNEMSPVYSGPFTLNQNSIIKAKAYNSNGRSSNTSTLY